MGIVRGMFITMLFITEKNEKTQHVKKKKIELDRVKVLVMENIVAKKVAWDFFIDSITHIILLSKKQFANK